MAVLVAVVILLAFGAGFALATRLRVATARHDEHAAMAPHEPPGTSFVRFDVIAPRGTRSASLEHHDEEWRAEMRAIGARLRAADVAAIVFVHGTFVGHDPLGLARLARRALPRTGGRVARALERTTREGIHAVLGDLGTYGAEYVALFERAIGGDIPCTRFAWSSENHHLARLRGAIDLARVLAVHAQMSPRRRLVLIGHSHAGQLFALLSHFLASGGEAAALYDVARAHGVDTTGLADAIESLRACALDVVTQGAAPRYRWTPRAGIRAMHLVNERDAIRRVAVHGSDLPAPTPSERAINARLVPLLGESTDARTLVQRALAPVRADTTGHTYFVDYGRRFLRDGAGHGVYTRFDAMLFNARLMVDHFYPVAPAA